jgi:hypothetical protein
LPPPCAHIGFVCLPITVRESASCCSSCAVDSLSVGIADDGSTIAPRLQRLFVQSYIRTEPALANPISNFACENPFYIWPRRPSSAQGFSVLIGSTDWFYAGLNIVCDANRVERRSHVTRLFRAGRASRIFDFSSKVAEWSKMLKTVLA